ncbi:MAG: glucoamylase family protein, partial [Dokdonella sp.]
MNGATQEEARDAAGIESPLRAELFSAEQMERHGAILANSHHLQPNRISEQLLRRLTDNQRVLEQARESLAAAAAANRSITPAGEWLLDNFYVIDEQIRTARRHLPKGYSRELPRLAEGGSAGMPRVYDIALEAISHGDGRVDEESLTRFVAAYQVVTPLALGELWAIPIMLRLALIENLRRVAGCIIVDRRDRDLAEDWSDRMVATAATDPKNVVLVIADMARSEPPLSSPFVAELTRRLSGQSSTLALPLSWVEQWLSESGQTIERKIQTENRHQAADQVSISNSIGSLRFLSTTDWREFVETLSVVERALRNDPDGTYGMADFATRDSYRHCVERVARNSDLDEGSVADQVLALAHSAATQHGASHVSAHVGYWLIDDGFAELARRTGMRRGISGWLRHFAAKMPLTLYLGSIALVTAMFASGMLREAWQELAHAVVYPRLLLGSVAVLAVITFSELAIALVNWAATLFASPRQLPRLDYSQGLPSSARSLVAVPTMLSGREAIATLAEALEVRFLANRDEHLHFALLTDFLDADEQQQPGDNDLLAFAVAEIDRLNDRHADERRDRFFLFHRPRLWNSREGVWMGYERKRGKLAALNDFILSGDSSAFSCVTGNTRTLSSVRYVITLDSDTQLSRDSAREFIATLAHPLNRAIIDPAKGRVVRGYGILQPRVGTSLSRGSLSRYARLFGTEPGIDPYTRAVSDVYQDLFDEGAFVGKGIYEVATFESVLRDRFPENRILSHDLLEGCYVRAGLVSDAQLYEDYPSRYSADVKRRHRWIRGDWQLIPWLLPWVPRRDGKYESNPLTVLSRWKVLDNLRRSLVPATAVALLVAGWLVPSMPGTWTMWALAFLYVPPLAASLVDAFHKPEDLPWATHLRFATDAIRKHFVRLPVVLACLPYEAGYSLHAIAKTLWRTIISGRHLLQWQPSSEVDQSLPDSMLAEWRRMAIAPLFATGVGVSVFLLHPMALPVAAPVLLLWALSPALMAWLGRPQPRRSTRLDAEQRQFLGSLSRKTWAFFDAFVTADDHWLPPDNVQEQPSRTIAHRTSPTNIGLYLLSNLAARDFGYISATSATQRIADTLATMSRMERFRGHFYNWYDTENLQPMPPRYVSTVDSGNLAGHLLTLQQGLLAMIDEPVMTLRVLGGLIDTVAALEDVNSTAIDTAIAELHHELLQARQLPPVDLVGLRSLLETFAERAHHIDAAETPRSDLARQWTTALALQCEDLCDDAATWLGADHDVNGIPTLRELAGSNDSHIRVRAQQRIAELQRLATKAATFAHFDFDFLYDRHRHLLRIGYNADEQRGDDSYYDLLASEARLGTFVGIAQGQLPQEAWFALGRLLTESDGEPVLLSWSGSMFEYLMPQLVMPSYPGTLLDQTTLKSVQMQIDYGRHLGIPWGISESGYNAVDARLNYQYRAFGVPTLGLKRGLSQDRVIAPYASMMALMVAPAEACENLQRLVRSGYEGDYGLFEAIDFTASRLPRGQDEAVIRSFMAHHQGMGFLAMAYLLLDQPMQRRFAADPHFQATLLLLQERVPRMGAFLPHATDMGSEVVVADTNETRLRIFHTPDTERPAVQMLSNGRYHVMVTAAGGGYSRRHAMAVTRWREDSTRDPWGSFCYLRDVSSGDYWSASGQPTGVVVDDYEAIFSDAKAEFRGRRNGYETHMEIAVSPEDDIELRRLKISHRGRGRRVIEITTYAEVVLAESVADEMHPAFSNLFVQSELVRTKQALLCTRRARAEGDATPWMFHLMAVHGGDVADISYETDRAMFLGRGHSPADPHAVVDPARERLGDSEGSVLDPIVAIRVRIALDPDQAVTIDMVSGVSDQREGSLALIDKYRDRRLADRVFDLAWTHSQVVRHQIKASQADAQLYERLAGVVLYAHPLLRADAAVLLQNRRGQSGLWGQAISGDLPIVLLKIADPDNINLVRQVVQAHAYWRLKGLIVDLVIWNEDQVGYRQELHEQILGLIAAGVENNIIDRPGGIFVRPAQQLSNEDRVLLQSVARVVLTDRAGTLADQVLRAKPAEPLPPLLTVQPHMASSGHALEPLALILENGHGGFTPDGREYVITGIADQMTPAPWSNVIANERLGCVLSESSLGYTWSENAHEFRLTPWHNDPVADPSGEAIYLRDEDSGRVWSPTRLPCADAGEYRVRHGFGYSVFEHVGQGIASELTVFVDVEAPVKFLRLKLRNVSDSSRRLSITGYVEWVLGDLRARSQMHMVSAIDPQSGLVLVSNPYNTEFADRTAFLDCDAETRSVTCDRTEFIGRNGSMADPAGLRRSRLSWRSGAGLDPCAAIQAFVELDAGGQHELVFRLGVGRNESDASRIANQHRGNAAAAAALQRVHAHWEQMLGAVQVKTLDPAVDVLANGWLLYQTIACRFVARSGYYQSGGAYGFRDQLQDAMAMVHADAPRLREHLL